MPLLLYTLHQTTIIVYSVTEDDGQKALNQLKPGLGKVTYFAGQSGIRSTEHSLVIAPPPANMSTAIVSPLPAHDPNAHALPDAVIEDSVDTVANTQDADEMSAHAQAQAHRVRAATVGNPVVSAAGGLRSPGKPNTTPSPARSVSFVNGAQGQAQAGAGERESAGTSTGDVDGSPRLPVSADGRAKAAALVSGDVGKSTGGAGLDGTTHGTGQMGAMASEPDLVHDVSYDRESMRYTICQNPSLYLSNHTSHTREPWNAIKFRSVTTTTPFILTPRCARTQTWGSPSTAPSVHGPA